MAEASDKINSLGFEKSFYIGAKSTLCTGCGHDSVTNHLITALFRSGINPYKVAKMSGIGCSSKTPTYFLSKSHGFNAIHGRMAPVATGAYLANKELHMVGISGDGDTASIGLGSFLHLLRRQVPLLYIVENNGVYGLTKGQFSATADKDSYLKSGEENHFSGMDLCAMAIEAGCSFVARSFSGDAKQLVPLLQAALQHQGSAFIDVISPCITFANHEGSTKSFNAVKAHNIHLQELGFIQPQEDIKVDYPEGSRHEIKLHDGSILWLSKMNSQEHDVTDKVHALQVLHEAIERKEFLTGLFYINEQTQTLEQSLKLGPNPLKDLDESTRPTAASLDEILKEFY